MGKRGPKAGQGGADLAEPAFRDRSGAPVQAAAEEDPRSAVLWTGSGRREEEGSVWGGLRGSDAEPPAALRRRHLGRAGRPGAVPRAPSVSGLPGGAAEAAEPGGSGQGPDGHRVRESADLRGAARVREPRADRPREPDCQPHSAGDSRPAPLPERCRCGVPHAGPQRRDALRRRRPAHPSGDPDWLEPDRRALRARRAVDRPAPARQPRAAGDAGAAPRSGQHRRGGRARRGDDSHGRLRDRSRAGRGRTRRPRDLPGQAGGAPEQRSRVAHRRVPPPRESDPDSRARGVRPTADPSSSRVRARTT